MKKNKSTEKYIKMFIPKSTFESLAKINIYIQALREQISTLPQENNILKDILENILKIQNNFKLQLENTLLETMEIAFIDTLTQIFNNNALLKILDYFFNKKTIEERKTDFYFYIDLNNFKQINDKHGHQIGDKALQKYALIMSEVAKKYEEKYGATIKVFRQGGDEFVITIENGSEEIAKKMAKEIAEKMAKSYILKPKNKKSRNKFIKIPLSFPGIGISPMNIKTIKELKDLADYLMYLSKNTGKANNEFDLEYITPENIEKLKDWEEILKKSKERKRKKEEKQSTKFQEPSFKTKKNPKKTSSYHLKIPPSRKKKEA